jgi:thiamine phosphate synthase YjbQ (UPF0047 family)
LCYQQENVQRLIGIFQKLFPEGEDYYHDRLELRTELSVQQRLSEPKNADAHLIFMSSGLSNCVTYTHRPDSTVFLVDLDGVHGSVCRTRRTMVVGFNTAAVLHQTRVVVPIAQASMHAVNLGYSQHSLLQYVETLLQKFDVDVGKVEIALAPYEHNVRLTVNEYEPLLMQQDLSAVLRNPWKFLTGADIAPQGNLETGPSAILSKAQEGLMPMIRTLTNALCLNHAWAEKIISTLLRWPTSSLFRKQRKISLLVSQGKIIQGTYQSPILVQWSALREQTRSLDIVLTRFA